MDKKLSKQFISRQKEKLLKEKEKTLKQIESLKKDDPFADPEHATDNAAVDTDVREQVNHQTIETEILVMEKRVKDIDLAIKKIEKDTYGYCEKCNRPIPIARLELIPEARFCVECEGKLRK